MDKNNSLPLVVAVLVMAATTVFALVYKGDSSQEASTETAELQSSVKDLADQVGRMQEQMTSMTAQIQAANSPGKMANSGVRRETSQAQIDRMVADAVARMSPNTDQVAGLDGAMTPAEEELAKQAKLDDALSKFLNPDLTESEFEQLWKDLAEAGLMEDAIAMLEDQAAAYPEDEDLQVQLGLAYLQPMNVGNIAGAEAGQWAMKADATFDRVLENNPENWDARFIKAMSYSFWPPAFGKQQSAIDHFEVLVDQQSRQNSDPKFAQTHVFLGNLYYQTGQADKAQEAWASGLAQYPDNKELQEKAGSQ
jgi:tetratricopeptide (TPR) repeat protein